MSLLRKLLNVPWLAVLALTTTAVRPILAPNLPCSDDVAFHLLRAVQLDHLIRQGVWFSRWAPDMAQGYGYPFFNFYAPLSTYTAVLLGWLSDNLHLGLRLTFAFGLFAGGLAMYRLARDHFSNVAAVVAAVAYVYAPYQGYDIYFRGNLAESFAWWLLPLALWGMGRLARTGQAKWFLLTVVSYTAVILTHNAFALVFSPLLGLYGLFWVWQGKDLTQSRKEAKKIWGRRLGLVVLACAFGILLTAFFWLPALAERAYVHSDRLLVPPVFVYWGNFITLPELLALPRRVPTDLVNPSIPRALGLVHVLLALPSLFWFAINRRSHTTQVVSTKSSNFDAEAQRSREAEVLSSRYRFSPRSLRSRWFKNFLPTTPTTSFIFHPSSFILFLWLATFTYAALTLAPSRPIWDSLPLLEYVQFPWRLLGTAALTLSLLIAASLDALSQLANQLSNLPRDLTQSRKGKKNAKNENYRENNVFLGLFATFSLCVKSLKLCVGYITNKLTTEIITLSLGVLFATALIFSTPYYFSPNYCEGLNNPTVADIAAFERATQTIGTTAKGEYLPRTVVAMPDEPYRQPFVENPAWLAMGREPLRLWGEIENNTAVPLTITANVFMYPGWTATVDGEEVDITPTAVQGLAQISVPTGRHTVELTFDTTPLRQAAALTSLLSLLGLFAVMGWLVTNQPTSKPTRLLAERQMAKVVGEHQPDHEHVGKTAKAVTTNSIYPLTILGLVLLTFVHYVNSPIRYDGRDWLESQPEARPAVYQGGLVLLGYELGARAMPADGQLPVTLWLGADRQTDANYQTLVQLVDENGTVWSGKEATRPRVFRPYFDSRSWPLDEYAEDLLWAEAIPGTPPGTYSVQLVAFDQETLAPAPLLDGQLAFDLGTVQLTPPRDTAVVNEAIEPLYETNHLFAEAGLRLRGYHPDRDTAAPGDPFLLTLYWQAEGDERENSTAVLTLLAPDGDPVLTQELPPVRADFPPSQWPADEAIWRGQHGFRLPAGLESGLHQWQLQLCQAERACSEPLALSSLQINAPERSFVPPAEMDVETNTAVGELATLLGANLRETDGTLEVELFWRVDGATETSYRVFVHLLDEAEQVAAQSDGEPAGWTRPTTGWLAGEIITDAHAIPLPPAWDALVVGLYDPETGVRLGTVSIVNGE